MIDIDSNRRSRKWTRREQIGRVFWALLQPVFRFSPRPMWGIRRGILRMFGAKIGDHVHIYPSVDISCPWNLTIGQYSAIGHRVIVYALGPITIGERTTISQYAHLCAGSHDYNHADFALQKLSINIGNDTWVCAAAFIGPGVKVGDRAIVGACAVAMQDVSCDTIVGGNPARKIKDRPAAGG